MSLMFFPSCKTTAQFKEASKKAKKYVNQKFGVLPIGCCRPNHKKLAPDDNALVVCNNCAAIIEENTDASIIFYGKLLIQIIIFNFQIIMEKKLLFRIAGYHLKKETYKIQFVLCY